MKLSIIIPFHKGIHFLEDCLDSIREQGIVDYETIVVLDHPDEDISQLVDNYKDVNIVTVEVKSPGLFSFTSYSDIKEEDKPLKTYSGVAAARNAGLEVARGEYIYFLDSDDYIINGTLALLLKEANEQKADITYGRKASTWFSKNVFLNSYESNKSEALEEEQNESLEEELNIKLNNRQAKIDEIKLCLEESSKDELEMTVGKPEAYYYLFTSKKGMINVSVLNIMFRREFILENKIRFNEEFFYYSDIEFVVQALKKLKSAYYVEDAIYVKRKHNDPIHFPSLSQAKTGDRFNEHVSSYIHVRKYTCKNDVIRTHLEKKLLTYFTNTYAPLLRRSEKEIWRTKNFQSMRDLVKDVEPERVKALKGYKKVIIKALLRGSVTQVRLFVTINLATKKLRKVKKNKRVIAYYLYNKFFTKMPVKDNYVILESFFGKSYSDSPKYIFEYLSKNYPNKYKFIWILNKKTKLPYKSVQVKRFSIRYCYYMAVSKYNVFNVRQPEWYRKREGNVFLETWHGTPLKKLVFDQEEVMGASPLYKAQFYKQSRVWDYLVSANRFSSDVFRSAFLFDKEMLEYGYPRNDILNSENRDEIAARIRKKLHIPEGKKTILYAPTWRDDEYYGRGEYKFTLNLDLPRLKKEFGDEYVVLLRTHYFIADSLDVSEVQDFAINVSKYDDISELYLISDMLITDYSSVFFDYANLKRPILFYTYDIEKYRDMIRGFYLDIDTEIPGPLLYSNDEVVEAIKNIEQYNAEYSDRYERFFERFCSLEDGHASEKVAKRVFDL